MKRGDQCSLYVTEFVTINFTVVIVYNGNTLWGEI